MKIRLLILFSFLITPVFNFAQQTGKVDYPELGLSFTIPNGWMGQESGDVYLMTSNSYPGMIILLPHEEQLTLQEMIDETRENGIVFDQGNSIKPIEGLQKLDERSVGGFFQGNLEYQPTKAYVIGIANAYGNGLTILAMTSPEQFKNEQYKSFAIDIKNSVQFNKTAQPHTPSIPSNSAKRSNIEEWKYQLDGTLLTYMESYSSGGMSGGGYNMQTEIHLCAAGYFLYKDQNFMSAGGQNTTAYSAGNSKGDGNWDIVENGNKTLLVLNFGNGGSKSYELTWDGNKLLLNGYRYFRTWEGEYAPNCGQ